MSTRKHNPRNEKPISLNPLSLEEALGKAMNVEPSSEKYTYLVKLLSGIPINGRDRRRAYEVAGELLHFVLGESWDQLSDTTKQRLTKPSAKRLWDNYMHNLKRLTQSHQEAAEGAIDDELSYLQEQLNQSRKITDL